MSTQRDFINQLLDRIKVLEAMVSPKPEAPKDIWCNVYFNSNGEFKQFGAWTIDDNIPFKFNHNAVPCHYKLVTETKE